MSYVSEAAKNNNSALRRQIEGANHGQYGRKGVTEANKALIAIMPVPELSTVATNHGNVGTD